MRIVTRRSCGVELEENFIVTGGYIEGATSGRVTAYSRTGDYQDLGQLAVDRDNHACTKYRDNQDNFVRQSILFLSPSSLITTDPPGDWGVQSHLQLSHLYGDLH